MALDRVKKTDNFELYKDVPARIFNEESRYGDNTVRLPSDVFGKELYDQRDKEQSRAKRLREKFLPTIPGFVAEKLTNRYAQDKYLDKLTELAVDAVLIKEKVPFAMAAACVGAVVDWVKDFRTNPVSLFTKIGDNIAAVKKESLQLTQLYNKKSLEYLNLVNVMMQDERRDWQLYRMSEMDRAYFSQNRQEWFFVGAALSGLHHSVNYSVNEMDRATLESYKRIEGSTMREILNPGLSLLDSAFETFKFSPKKKKNP